MKVITYLFIFLLLISVAVATDAPAPPPVGTFTIEAGTIIDDGNYTYIVTTTVTVETLEVNEGYIYLDGVSYCNSGYTSYFNSTKTCSGSSSQGSAPPPSTSDATASTDSETSSGSSDNDDDETFWAIFSADKNIFGKINPLKNAVSFFSGDTENSLLASILIGILISLVISMIVFRHRPPTHLHTKYVDVDVKNFK